MSLLDVLALVLIIGWLLGLFALKVTSGFLHLLLVVAVVVIVIRLIRGPGV